MKKDLLFPLAIFLLTTQATASFGLTNTNSAATKKLYNGVLKPAAPKNTKSSSTTTALQAASVASGGALASEESGNNGGGTATIPNEIFNLVKNIVGAGVLSLPAGIASFGNAPSAIIPATALIAVIGAASGYCFSAIGRVCAMENATSYRDAWSKTVGESTSWIPAAICTFKTSSANLAYSMILADTFKALLSTVGVNLSRDVVLVGTTVSVLLPLCLLKNLASLAPFSLLGIVGMAYTTLAMAIRYFGGAYSAAGGKFVADVAPALQPSFGSTGAAGVLDPKAFILISMLSTAYMAHFNAPKFYLELKNNTIERYNKVVSTSFLLSILTFAGIASLGFLTFGANANGLILNNYSNKDTLMAFSRVAVALSIVFSYPLAFVGFRDGVIDLLQIPSEKRTNAKLNQLTVVLLSIVTVLASKVKDLSFLLSFAGATLGNALIYVFPAMMFRAAVKKLGDKATAAQKAEATGIMGIAGMGIGMGFVGAKMAIKSLSK
mmetsp:Transcript_10660/g.16002  ORF Transcript_10660/g.16002 Transcript_10660/m.16002 type:complete len:495 (-) Transcript_10660:116-1600(-)